MSYIHEGWNSKPDRSPTTTVSRIFDREGTFSAGSPRRGVKRTRERYSPVHSSLLSSASTGVHPIVKSAQGNTSSGLGDFSRTKEKQHREILESIKLRGYYISSRQAFLLCRRPLIKSSVSSFCRTNFDFSFRPPILKYRYSKNKTTIHAFDRV